MPDALGDHGTESGHLVLIATALVAAVLGSIHAFSVFLAPLEATFGLSRATVSLTYSLALVALTLVVTIGPAIINDTSTSATWLVDSPRTWRTASIVSPRPCM